MRSVTAGKCGHRVQTAHLDTLRDYRPVTEHSSRVIELFTLTKTSNVTTSLSNYFTFLISDIFYLQIKFYENNLLRSNSG